ncbi:hypothetical protein Ro1_00196 [Raoultella phage Ro1]|uniref:Inh N-terminal domain-containing protein n=1 Tax=Raoultella phage Ro1 TaxID=2053702 RepID=A0A2H4YGV9_9CAUD|nr:hypothetical protein HWB37_gp228 [Raoultella phage Ro1]AUE23401.1 hypothetical protein Ro1_00196 [Raoultella phage Ro1]
MAKQNYRIFPNKVELFKFFGAYIPELNISASSRLPLNGFALGKQLKAFRSFMEFFQELADLSGLPVDTKTSTLRMGNFIVFFNGDITPPSDVKPAVIKPKVEDKAEVIETASADVKALIAEASALLDEADKKGSKDKLAEFAANNGVTLSKSKTFENMLADFESALK